MADCTEWGVAWCCMCQEPGVEAWLKALELEIHAAWHITWHFKHFKMSILLKTMWNMRKWLWNGSLLFFEIDEANCAAQTIREICVTLDMFGQISPRKLTLSSTCWMMIETVKFPMMLGEVEVAEFGGISPTTDSNDFRWTAGWTFRWESVRVSSGL